MASNFECFLEELHTAKTKPLSARFVSFSEQLEPSELRKLSAALKSTAATGVSLSGLYIKSLVTSCVDVSKSPGLTYAGCQLGDEGLEMISEVLGSHQHLATVELSGEASCPEVLQAVCQWSACAECDCLMC